MFQGNERVGRIFVAGRSRQPQTAGSILCATFLSILITNLSLLAREHPLDLWSLVVVCRCDPSFLSPRSLVSLLDTCRIFSCQHRNQSNHQSNVVPRRQLISGAIFWCRKCGQSGCQGPGHGHAGELSQASMYIMPTSIVGFITCTCNHFIISSWQFLHVFHPHCIFIRHAMNRRCSSHIAWSWLLAVAWSQPPFAIRLTLFACKCRQRARNSSRQSTLGCRYTGLPVLQTASTLASRPHIWGSGCMGAFVLVYILTNLSTPKSKTNGLAAQGMTSALEPSWGWDVSAALLVALLGHHQS